MTPPNKTPIKIIRASTTLAPDESLLLVSPKGSVVSPGRNSSSWFLWAVSRLTGRADAGEPGEVAGVGVVDGVGSRLMASVEDASNSSVAYRYTIEPQLLHRDV